MHIRFYNYGGDEERFGQFIVDMEAAFGKIHGSREHVKWSNRHFTWRHYEAPVAAPSADLEEHAIPLVTHLYTRTPEATLWLLARTDFPYEVLEG